MLFPGFLFIYGCSKPDAKAGKKDEVQWEIEWARLDSTIQSLGDDFQKTNFLRSYCSELTDLGIIDPESLKWYRSVSYDSFQISEFYPYWKSDSLATDCGMTSYLFVKLAESFGFKAYQYSFGFTDEPYAKFIHSFPLVEIEYSGTRKLIVQDPYLNITFTTDRGEPLDFYKMLSSIKSKKYDSVIMRQHSSLTNLIINDTLTYWSRLDDSCRSLLRNRIQIGEKEFKKTIPIQRNYQTLMQSTCAHFENGFLNAMRQNGYSEPFLYAYTLRVNEMVGSSDRKIIQSKIDSVLRNTSVK
ncbi:MAG: hypothetical protein ACXWV5_11605 [Flavitalea sp.]